MEATRDGLIHTKGRQRERVGRIEREWKGSAAEEEREGGGRQRETDLKATSGVKWRLRLVYARAQVGRDAEVSMCQQVSFRGSQGSFLGAQGSFWHTSAHGRAKSR